MPNLSEPDMEEMDSNGKHKWKLLLSVEVARHGERAPHYIYPFAEDPDQNFSVPYNLTATGAESHYANGKGLRNFFERHNDGGEGFLSAEYNETEVYV